MTQLLALSESVPREPGARVYQFTVQLLPVSMASVADSDDSSS